MRKNKDITGQRFGQLLAIEKVGEKKYSKATEDIWRFQCDCGNYKDILVMNVKAGKTVSCGCHASKSISQRQTKDLIGLNFGKLTALERVSEIGEVVKWKCLCECGNYHIVNAVNLVKGFTKSCGCIRAKKTEIKVKNTESMVGKKYGKLTVISKTDERNAHNDILLLCKCDCGKYHKTVGSRLKHGQTKSCGCIVSSDITGIKVGKLTVLSKTNKRNNDGLIFWECLCDCGNYCSIASAQLRNGRSKSCGRCNGIPGDITGNRFGRLKALSNTGKKTNKGCYIWLCRCDCGNEVESSIEQLNKGHKLSCGCQAKEVWSQRGKEAQLNNIFGYIDNTCYSAIKDMKLSIRNKTGVRGVQYRPKEDRYLAIITFKKKVYYLGRHKTLEEAAKVRKQAEEMLFEPFLEWYNENFKKNDKGSEASDNGKS